jgi:hypothetical protein
VAHARIGGCAVVGVTERATAGIPAVPSDRPDMPSLEELGVDDWDVQLLRGLVPADRPIAVRPNPASWAFSGLRGRARAIKLLDADTTAERDALFASLAYDDETAPEFIWVPPGTGLPPEHRLREWSANASSWRHPDRLVPDPIDRIVARFAGWAHVAVRFEELPAVLSTLERIAAGWGLSIRDAPPEWAWALG